MTSWEILKKEMVQETKPNSVGYYRAVNLAAEIFVRLMENLTDKDAACESFNADNEVREAILNRKGIEEMKKAGIL